MAKVYYQDNGCAWLKNHQMVLEECTPRQAYDMYHLEMVWGMYIRVKGKYYYSIRSITDMRGEILVNLYRHKQGRFKSIAGNIWCDMDFVSGYERNKHKIIDVSQIQ